MAEEALAFSTQDKHANYFRLLYFALPLRSFYPDYDWRFKYKCHSLDKVGGKYSRFFFFTCVHYLSGTLTVFLPFFCIFFLLFLVLIGYIELVA